MTESQPSKKTTVVTTEMIEEITKTLREMEGQEIEEGAPVKLSSKSLSSEARALWSISYTTRRAQE